MNPCCATECDISLVMGYCPRRSLPARNGPHRGRGMVKPAHLEADGWPLPEAILSWADRASPGERIVYFSGFLANTPEAGDIGRAAMQLKDQGAVVLFQKRTGPEAFDYIAERRGA